MVRGRVIQWFFITFTNKIQISSLSYHSLCFCSSALEVPCVRYSCAWTSRLLSDSSSTHLRSNWSMCSLWEPCTQLLLGTLDILTDAGKSEAELLATEGHQQGSPLHCFRPLGHLQSWQNLSCYRIWGPKTSIHNQGSSHFIINSPNDNWSFYHIFSTLPSSLSGPFLIFTDF